MKCKHLLIVLKDDLTEDKKELKKLRTHFNTIEGLYLIDILANGLHYLIETEKMGEVGRAIDRSPYEVVTQDVIDKRDELIVILKPLGKTFREMDDSRLSSMFDKD